MNEVKGQKVAEQKSETKKEHTCNNSHTKLWCISIMAIVIIALVWMPGYSETWSKVVVTILATLIFARSLAFNCCK